MLDDPNDPGIVGKPLWCVYAVACFPTMVCCKILTDAIYGPIVWGYNEYRGLEPCAVQLPTSTSDWYFENIDGWPWYVHMAEQVAARLITQTSHEI